MTKDGNNSGNSGDDSWETQWKEQWWRQLGDTMDTMGHNGNNRVRALAPVGERIKTRTTIRLLWLSFFFIRLFPGCVLKIQFYDESPFWFNAIDSQETMDLRGSRTCERRTNYCATRERASRMTNVCGWFLNKRPNIGLLFKGLTLQSLKLNGEELRAPPDIKLQFAGEGSYDEEKTIEWLEFDLPIITEKLCSHYVALFRSASHCLWHYFFSEIV